jgi:hypothetical protein
MQETPSSISPMNSSNPILEGITDKSTISESEINHYSPPASENKEDGFERFTGKRWWGAVLLATLVSILSVLPPLLVVLDRWIFFKPIMDFSINNWCKVQILCWAGFQDYFFWIFNCLTIVAVLILVFARPYFGKVETASSPTRSAGEPASISQDQLSLRKKLLFIATLGLILDIGLSILYRRPPGFELMLNAALFLVALILGEKEIDAGVLRDWIEALKEKAPLYGTILFSEIALVLFSRELLSFRRMNWIYIILFLLALATVVWQRKKLGKIYWLFNLTIVLFMLNLNSWKFSKIGDEYDFFDFPTYIIARQSVFQIWGTFFTALQVHSRYAYISSFVQFISMRLLGFDHFGWHFINILLVALTIPILYNFLKSFVAERIAFIAVVLLAASQYLINFSKIGYNNLQALFVMILILWMASRALKEQTSSAYFLLGISMAGCFYSFPAALYMLPLPVFLLLLYSPPKSWAVWRKYGFMLAGLLLLIIPLVFQPNFWLEMLKGTALNTSETASDSIGFVNHLITDFLYTVFTYLFVADEGHFVVSSFVDPLTAVFVPLGVLLVICNLRRSRFMIFLAVSFLVEIILIGTTSNYNSYTPKTRLFLILPFFFIFAAIGIDWLIRLIAGITAQPGKFMIYSTAVVLIAVVCLNLIQANVIFRIRKGESNELEAVFLRMLQHDAPEGTYDYKNYLLLSDSDRDWSWNLKFQEVYGLPASKAQLLQAVVEGDKIPEMWLQRIQERNMVVIIPAWTSDPVKNALSMQLHDLDKVPCSVNYDPDSDILFQMWTSHDYQDLCLKALSQN